jgi:predicted DNA binding protein
MIVLTEIRACASTVGFGDLLADVRAEFVDLEPSVPVGSDQVPLLWLHGRDQESISRELSESDVVETAVQVEDGGTRGLYWIEWADSDPVLSAIREVGGLLRGGAGDRTDWQFSIQFRDPDDFTAFKQTCADSSVEVTLDRVKYGKTEEGADDTLTPEQREILQLAAHKGYFDVPRQCILDDLATELGISDQAASARLRRGFKRLVQEVPGANARAPVND